MPLHKKPNNPLTGEQRAFLIREHVYHAVERANKHMNGMRRAITGAGSSAADRQAISDALGASDLAELETAYSALRTFIQACGDNCPDLPDLPTTTNP